MSNSIIEVRNLSKKFIISHEGQTGGSYTALRDVISEKAKKIFSFPSSLRATKQSATQEEFWALKDITFDIQQGDRLGIIGRNGAGKSTLLKILSRITEPSAGQIKIKGRVASLLEVGTGFHPELTGRENIYLNGAILGMSRAEIKRKFDEIVDFAEVEKFLDTPVKRYSSGMYVRLAFAVAAHLEPEILVVDEVLAVGDAQFQKKCLGKLEDVSKKEGRTVLFVSHNIDAISVLTNKCLLLSKGNLLFFSKTSDVIVRYLHNGSADNVYKSETFRKGIYFSEISTMSEGFLHNEPIVFKIQIQSDCNVENVILGIGIYNMYEQYVGNRNIESAFNLKIGINVYDIKIFNHNLVPNQYKGVFAIAMNKTYDIYDAVLGNPTFTIFNDENDTKLLSRWQTQFGSHYFSEIKIERL